MKNTNTASTVTPDLSRAGRRIADATLEAAKFQPTVDGKREVRRYEVHGMAVTEWRAVDQTPRAAT
jgi:hypothetical protein